MRSWSMIEQRIRSMHDFERNSFTYLLTLAEQQGWQQQRWQLPYLVNYYYISKID